MVPRAGLARDALLPLLVVDRWWSVNCALVRTVEAGAVCIVEGNLCIVERTV